LSPQARDADSRVRLRTVEVSALAVSFASFIAHTMRPDHIATQPQELVLEHLPLGGVRFTYHDLAVFNGVLPASMSRGNMIQRSVLGRQRPPRERALVILPRE
jgi:hypothetical protein